MKKKTLILIVVGVVVLAGLGIALMFVLKGTKSNDDMKDSNFAAVYMATGDIYFGKIDWFPWPRLKNVWYLQRTVDQKQQQQMGVAPLKSVFWTPIDEIYLNPKEIVFWTKVKAGSELANALENPEGFTKQLQQQQLQSGTPSAPSGDAFKGPDAQPPVKK